MKKDKKVGFVRMKNVMKPIIFDPVDKKEGEEFRVVDEKVLPNVEPFRYLVSNLGRVYDTELERYKNPVPNCREEIRQPYYKLKFNYYDPKNDNTFKQKDIYIHRAVGSAFLENDDPENKTQVDHLDGDHSNNTVENLEWVSKLENDIRAKEKGFIPICEDKYGANFTNEQVHDICKMLVEGISSAEIARKYNVDPGTIYDIKARNTYTAISRNYNLPKTKRISNKLSEDMVHEVCRRLERGDRIIDIYTELHIDRSVVNSIKSGRYFKHISSQYNIPKVKPQKSFTDEELHDICRRLENKEGVYSIAKDYNIDPGIVAKIKNGSTHKDISSQYNIPKPGEQYIRDEYIRLICLLIENGDSDQCIYLKLKKYGVTKAIVNNIRNHKSGNHISKNFNF